MITYTLFFFPSRRRHSGFGCDWSSGVCSSDLLHDCYYEQISEGNLIGKIENNLQHVGIVHVADVPRQARARDRRDRLFKHRSEERRVGKSVDLGGRRIIKKKKES